MSGKRILLVTSWVYPHIGGVSSHLQLLARKLGIADSEVVSFRNIVSLKSRGLRRFETALQRHLRKFLKLEAISLFAKALSEIIERQNCDIVHCHDAMATWAAIRARRRSGRNFKIVSSVHGPVSRHMIEEGYAPDSADVKKVQECEREAWAGADAIIAVDTTQRDIVESQGGDLERITVIPNAVDIHRINLLANALQLTRKGARAHIFVPRRLSPKNGIEFIIRALQFFTSAKRPLLLIAGDGKERQRLEELVKELSLLDDVIFLGNLEHAVMLPLMCTSDIVVIPSVPIHGIEEATSIAALEAMALSKAIIASDLGGLKELIVNGESGVLVPPADAQSLAETVSDLLANESKRVMLGGSARRAVAASFSDLLWFENIQKVYSRVSHE